MFWNDFEGLNEELVTLSLIKSQNFQKIKADTWLENPENLTIFFEINENLKKNDVYYKIYKHMGNKIQHKLHINFDWFINEDKDKMYDIERQSYIIRHLLSGVSEKINNIVTKYSYHY